MILDSKLKLASNLSVASAGRVMTGIVTSPDKISIEKLRNLGSGEQLYCCVTVKSDFSDSTTYVKFSLLAEVQETSERLNQLAVGTYPSIPTPFPDNARLYTKLQPCFGSTGLIIGNASGQSKNFVAGRKYLIPILPFTKMTVFSAFTVAYAQYEATSNLYFCMQEIDGSAANTPEVNSISSGTIDVEIVTIADFGAGSGFNDQYFYPSTMKIS